MRYQICIPLLLGTAMAGVALPRIGRANVNDLLLQPRDDSDDDSFDPEDLSWITKLAAIGDSYSAGIGAGQKYGSSSITDLGNSQSDYSCSRYAGAYPNIVNMDDRLGGSDAKRDFQFKSCSGAVATDVLEKQIPKISSDQQAILLSVGGNDAQLTKVLNQCIFQWAALTDSQFAAAKSTAQKSSVTSSIWSSLVDWDSLEKSVTIGCEGQLKATEALIDGDDLSNKLDSVLDAAKEKLADDGMIYFTGYAKFFGTDLTSECDDVSWSMWMPKTLSSTAKLTKANRQGMNDLVDKMNDKLKAAADRAGSKVRFINFDDDVGYYNGRYCEPGVDEATEESNSRVGLMFYELSTSDPFGMTPWKRSGGESYNGTFYGDINLLSQITLLAEPDATFSQAQRMQNDTDSDSKPELSPIKLAASPSGSDPSDGDIASRGFEIPNILPDGFGRVFHPTMLLHTIIANRVIFEMVSDNEKKETGADIPRTVTIDSCPTTTSSDSTPSSLHCWDSGDWSDGGAVNPDNFKSRVPGACEALRQGFKRNDYLKDKSGFSYGMQLSDSDSGNTEKYWFSIGLNGEKSCDIEDINDPFEDGLVDCSTIFYDYTFEGCPSNGGRGGYVKAGCLTYGFEPCDNLTTTHEGGCWSAGGTDSMLVSSTG